MLPSPGTRVLLLTLSCVTLMFVHVRGHGRLWEPPSRSSMWRRGFASPINYQDNELFCGGFKVEYEDNGGKCGVCGDPWNGPRENEAGGKFAKGIIVRKYNVGQVINVTVDLTANHKGYFEFYLCPTDNPMQNITHECLAQYPLVEVKGGKARFEVPDTKSNTYVSLQVKLPANVKCRACVFQWKYNAGNSWGTNPDGKGCVGCGNQEQFYGCADIAIGHDDVVAAIPSDKPSSHVEPSGDTNNGNWQTTATPASKTGSPNDNAQQCNCKCPSTASALPDNVVSASLLTVMPMFINTLVLFASL